MHWRSEGLVIEQLVKLAGLVLFNDLIEGSDEFIVYEKQRSFADSVGLHGMRQLCRWLSQ